MTRLKKVRKVWVTDTVQMEPKEWSRKEKVVMLAPLSPPHLLDTFPWASKRLCSWITVNFAASFTPCVGKSRISLSAFLVFKGILSLAAPSPRTHLRLPYTCACFVWLLFPACHPMSLSQWRGCDAYSFVCVGPVLSPGTVLAYPYSPVSPCFLPPFQSFNLSHLPLSLVYLITLTQFTVSQYIF